MQNQLASNILSLTNISCIRGDNQLFTDINITVSNGELIRIRGENGSGKTSLLKIMSGISSPEQGDITWNGEDIKHSEAYAENIAYLAHKDGIKPELSTIENLEFYQKLFSCTDKKSVRNILQSLDLSHTIYLKARQLSFGQRRRLAFARLLLSPAKLWLLDEPFTGVDLAGRKLLEQQCIEFLLSNGMIIMTNHAEIENPELARLERSVALN